MIRKKSIENVNQSNKKREFKEAKNEFENDSDHFKLVVNSLFTENGKPQKGRRTTYDFARFKVNSRSRFF